MPTAQTKQWAAMLGHDPHSLISRLWNWGRVARIDPCRPKGATVNHLYQLIKDDERESTGEITAETIVVPQQHDPKPEPAKLDHDDAETMGGWIRQLLQGHRGVLACRYVLMQSMEQVGRDRHDAAVYALERMMAANRETVGRMKKLGMY